MKILILPVLCLLSCMTPASAETFSINDNLGSASERGIAFDLTNSSATQTVTLTGVFRLPIITSVNEGYNLWIRSGTVVGNIGVGSSGWTNYGNVTATGQSYGAPDFNLTTYQFDLGGLTIAPGETIGIWLKDSNQSVSFRYVNGGSTNVSSVAGFAEGSLDYTGYVGLGTNGNSPEVENSLFGPTRNFVGEIEYTVPSSGGSYSTWAAANGIPNELPGDDFDKDGISNLMEYALADTIPTQPDSAIGTLVNNQISYSKRTEAVANGDVTYAIETSTDLGITNDWTPVAPDVNDGTSITYTFPSGPTEDFGRLKVILLTTEASLTAD